MHDELTLNEMERNSPLWVKVEAYLRGRLESLRIQNDDRRPEVETAEIRGAISEIKKIVNEKDTALRDAKASGADYN